MSNPEEKQAPEQHGTPGDVYKAVDTVAEQLNSIEKFIARRFDEISMEINATSQQVDMAEEGIVNRFAEILEILKAISFSGDGNTPANAGVELEAVVQMTEEAANDILDAADRIGVRLHDDLATSDNQEAVASVNKDIETIILACAFQDVTGQRIRKSLENLKAIEERLSSALDKIGVDVEATTLQASPVKIERAATQDDIDALFDAENSDASG